MVFLWLPILGSPKCIAKNFSYDSVVCECNSTYCDSVGSATLPPVGQFSSYLTSRAGSRLEPTQGQVQANSSGTGERCRDVGGRCCTEQLHSIFCCLYIYIFFSISGLRLTIVPYQKYQKIRGFGGAMTDAAAINILSLSAGAQDQLLRQYFSPEGTPKDTEKQQSYASE